jgi:hypothetical protein
MRIGGAKIERVCRCHEMKGMRTCTPVAAGGPVALSGEMLQREAGLLDRPQRYPADHNVTRLTTTS